jgi:hypothetical protein
VHFLRGIVALFSQRRVLLKKKKCNIVLVHLFKGNCCLIYLVKEGYYYRKANGFSVIISFFDQIKQQFPFQNALKLCYICFSVIVPFFDQIKQQFPLKKCTKIMLHLFFCNSTLLWPNKAIICNIVLVHFFKGNFCFIWSKKGTITEKQM